MPVLPTFVQYLMYHFKRERCYAPIKKMQRIGTVCRQKTTISDLLEEENLKVILEKVRGLNEGDESFQSILGRLLSDKKEREETEHSFLTDKKSILKARDLDKEIQKKEKELKKLKEQKASLIKTP